MDRPDVPVSIFYLCFPFPPHRWPNPMVWSGQGSCARASIRAECTQSQGSDPPILDRRGGDGSALGSYRRLIECVDRFSLQSVTQEEGNLRSVVALRFSSLLSLSFLF